MVDSEQLDARGARPAARPAWVARACVVIPAFEAARRLPDVVAGLRAALPSLELLVVDDGSTDGTGALAVRLGCQLVSHGRNRGKGAALCTGLSTALARGHEVALTVDADGQHPAEQARGVLLAEPSGEALVLGARDLGRAGAPRANQASNAISNFFTRFAGRPLCDTQCGLRRYPIRATLGLAARGEGYDFESEVLLRAAWAGLPIVEHPIEVLYPADRVTHFRAARDPFRIVRTVVAALAERRAGGARG
jgi:glycosyltransferase involved in cell wall biosynthesis